ncbi:MAG TPA: hypothetical protein VG860_01725 [Terriglobia bacterium]|jgi:hypothetical protein|nr:hypothetical protein [Terriglobia bacterium]
MTDLTPTRLWRIEETIAPKTLDQFSRRKPPEPYQRLWRRAEYQKKIRPSMAVVRRKFRLPEWKSNTATNQQPRAVEFKKGDFSCKTPVTSTAIGRKQLNQESEEM